MPVESKKQPLTAAIIENAARRAAWILPAGRAEQIALSALPILELFKNSRRVLDFDSDPLAYLSVRESVKHREES